MRRPCMIVATTALLTMLFSCTADKITGNGSEATNGVCATARGPVDSAIVIAYPAGYIPVERNKPSPETTFTDRNGIFRFNLADKAWNLLVYDPTRELGAFAVRQKGRPSLGRIELDSVGSISGAIADSLIPKNSSFVGIKGSPFFARVINDSAFTISKVPPFSYRISLWVDSCGICAPQVPGIRIMTDSIIGGATVAPGTNDTMDYNR